MQRQSMSGQSPKVCPVNRQTGSILCSVYLGKHMYCKREVSLVDKRCMANEFWCVQLIVIYIRSDRLHEIKSAARSRQVAGTEVQLIVW